jgi:hypothetical protein
MGGGAYIYFSSAHFDIQHWIEGSAESDVPAVLTPPPTLEQQSLVSVDREARRATALYGDFGRMEDLDFQRHIKLRWSGSSSRTEVAIPTELSGMPNVNVLRMLISCLRLYP